MMKLAIPLVALFALTYAQQQCVSPSEMTANVTSSDYNEERKEIFAGFITLYYDALNQRIRTDDFYIDIPKPNERARFSIIVDHKQGVEYRVNLDAGTCEKGVPSRPFQPIEIPSTAHYRNDVYVGVEGQLGSSLRAQLWVGNTETGARYAGLWTENCLPVLDFYRSQTDWRHWNLFDVQNTVDPAKFEKPSNCP